MSIFITLGMYFKEGVGGLVKGDYVIIKGSVPGAMKRLIKIRYPIRARTSKILEPKIIEVVA